MPGDNLELEKAVQGPVAPLGGGGAKVSSINLDSYTLGMMGAYGIRTQGAWFGPGNPMPPAAQQAAGRQWDYQTGYNYNSNTPRYNEPVTYWMMRNLADSYDLLRVIIEKRKDELENLDWTIQPRKGAGKGHAKDADAVLEFLQFPDQINPFHTWFRAIVEDMLVCDAACILRRNTRGGGLFALELMDGATIIPLIDETGRLPLTGTAYQQSLKGIRAADYTRDDLLYMPRNKRTNRVYGFSPVEQIITTVNIALRRQLYQLQYYTEGNMPDLLLSTPAGWNPTQVGEFQKGWDEMLDAANQLGRRSTKFVPDGMKVVNTKEIALKDPMDEWLARICCFAFGLSPQGLIAQMNRSTAETAQEQAKLEGLGPLKKWAKTYMDYIISKWMNKPNLEFSWVLEEALDPLEKAQVQEIQVRTGTRRINEVRVEDGLDPYKDLQDDEGGAMVPEGAIQNQALNGQQTTALLQILSDVGTGSLPKAAAIEVIHASFPAFDEDGIKRMVNAIEIKEPEPIVAPVPGANPAAPAQGATPQAGAKPAVPASAEPQGQAKAKNALQGAAKAATGRAKTAPAPSTRPAFTKAEKALRSATKKLLRAQVGTMASKLTAAMGKLTKADEDDIDATVQQMLDMLDLKNAAVYERTAKQLKEALYKDAGYESFKAIAKDAMDNEDMLNQYNQGAADYAADSTAKLIKDIDNSTKDMIRGTVKSAVEEGWSTSDLADELQENYAFSDKRAEVIARTELADANVQGALAAYKDSGEVVGKEWLLSSDPCPVCEDAADMGKVDLDDDFGGTGDPPAHPNCTCDIAPVLTNEEDEQ